MFVYDNIDVVFWHLRLNYLPVRVKWFSLKCISVGSTLPWILLPYNIMSIILRLNGLLKRRLISKISFF